MKTIEELLRNLARPEVLEFGLVTNRLPSVNIGGKFEPVDDEAPGTERLLQMLVTMGGIRHVDTLSDKPVQWTTRLEGVGVIAVAAIMRKDIVQARFTVAKRETSTPSRDAPPSAPAPASMPPRMRVHPTPPSPIQPVTRPSERTSVNAPAPRPPTSQAAQRTVPLVESRVENRVVPAPATPSGTGISKIIGTVPSAAAPRASVQPPPAALPSGPPPPPKEPSPPPPVVSAPPAAKREKREPSWQDDDEPTLQTLSPMELERGPKPPRRPEAVAAAAPSVPPAKGPERRITTPTSVDAVDPDAILKAAAEKAAAERAAAERAASEKAAAEKAAAEKAAAEKAAAEKAAAEKAAAEKATAEKAAAERAAAEKAAAERPVARPLSEPVKSVIPPSNRAAEAARAAELKAKSISAEHAAIRTSERPSARLSAAPAKIPSVAPAAPSERQRVEGTAALESFLAMAVSARASDLIVAARRPVFLRVATDLLPRTQEVPPEHVERISKELVPMRLREPLERDGSCDFVAEHPAHGRFRVNVSRHRGGLKIHFRVIPREVASIAALGLPEDLTTALRHSRGLVLVTGPASQGKSTTLAALVDWLNRETQRHIVTIEEPIEHLHSNKKALVSQREVGVHVPSRSRGIRATLKEDADVIVIGHMCDAETIRLALEAADSGRLVLSSMATPSAAATIERIIQAFPAVEREWVRARLSTSLRLVVNQRLVPSSDRTRLHVAAEILPWSVGLYRILRDGRTHQIPALQQRGGPQVVRLDDALAELVRTHKVTADTARQYALSPADIPVPGGWTPAQARKS